MAGYLLAACPTCVDISDGNIRQFLSCPGIANEQHSLCDLCVEGPLQRCLECKVPIVEVKELKRNIGLEMLMNKMDFFACIFKDRGCNQTSKLHELKEHVWSCKYRGDIIPLCSLFRGHDKCMIIPTIHSRAQIIKHFKNRHKVGIMTGSKFSITLGIEAATGTTPDDPSPVLVNMENNETGPLILIVFVHKRGFLSWMCVVLWAAPGDKDVFKYYANVSIRNVHEENSWHVWSPEAVIDLKKAMEYLNIENYRCKIAIDFLKSYYVKDETALIGVTLKRKDPDVIDLTSEDAFNLEEMNGLEPNGLSGRSTPTVLDSVDDNMTNGTERQRPSQALGESSELVASTSPGLGNNIMPQTQLLQILPAAPTPGPSTGNDDRTITHEDVLCHECKRESICEIRHKCMECKNFNLCSHCAKNGIHTSNLQHALLSVRTKLQNDKLKHWEKRTKKGKGTEGKLMPGRKTNGDLNVTSNSTFTCENCQRSLHEGRGYQCLICPNSYICLECFDETEEHSSHFVILAWNERQHKNIDFYRTYIAQKLKCVTNKRSRISQGSSFN
ncbi:unnamed protein product [Orchesella dallaii]|uniref:ZZ-type domain-containing protein n=1 Tax=Orchesella dallaii TaxID=48710 RepID=A0ABP1RWU2_9HEXA